MKSLHQMLVLPKAGVEPTEHDHEDFESPDS